MKEWSHSDLVTRAARWLKNTYGCVIAFEEFGSPTGEIPDAIGWKSNGRSVLIECKTSRADYLRDKEKPFRQNLFMGVGAERYYMIPEGAFTIDICHDLPVDWGLLAVKGNGVKIVAAARPRKDLRSADAMKYEMRMLITALNRVSCRIAPGNLTEWVKWDERYKDETAIKASADEVDRDAFTLGMQGWLPVVNPAELPIDEDVSDEPFCPLHESLFKDCICLGPYEAHVRYEYFGDKLYGMPMATRLAKFESQSEAQKKWGVAMSLETHNAPQSDQ